MPYPELLVAAFFCALAFLIFRMAKWGLTLFQEGWWTSDSATSTWRVVIAGFVTAVLFSIIVLASPHGDSDEFLVGFVWLSLGVFLLFYRIQISGVEERKYIV